MDGGGVRTQKSVTFRRGSVVFTVINSGISPASRQGWLSSLSRAEIMDPRPPDRRRVAEEKRNPGDCTFFEACPMVHHGKWEVALEDWAAAKFFNFSMQRAQNERTRNYKKIRLSGLLLKLRYKFVLYLLERVILKINARRSMKQICIANLYLSIVFIT